MTQSPIPVRPISPLRSDLAATHNSAATLVRAAAAYLVANARGGAPVTEAGTLWPSDHKLHLLVKSTVNPATTSQSGWADTLAMTALYDFIVMMGPASAGAALLARGLALEFDGHHCIQVPGLLSDATNTSFVQQGSAIPVRQLSVDAGATLAPCKFATLTTFTREISERSVPSIEAFTRALLTESVGLALDIALLDDVVGSTARPAGLRQGIAGLVPSTLPSASEAMKADITALTTSVCAVAGNNPIVLVAAPAQAIALRLWRERNAFEIFASGGLAAGTVVAIAPNAIVSALDPLPRFDIARDSTLHMETSPTAISALGSPPTVAAPVRSLWQTDSIGLRMIMEVSWGLRSASGLAWMTGVGW